MKQYLDVLRNVHDNGISKDNRTGVGTKYIFSEKFRCDLRDGFPLLTTKKINFSKVVGELFGFLTGADTVQAFQKFDCNIWDPWGLKQEVYRLLQVKPEDYAQALADKTGVSLEEAQKTLEEVAQTFQVWFDKQQQAVMAIASGGGADDPDNKKSYQSMNELLAEKPPTPEEYLTGKGVSLYIKDIIYPEGYLGPIYGKQWLEWRTSTGALINQVKLIADQLQYNPMSRRIILTGHNPEVVPADRYTHFPDGRPVTNSDENVQASILHGKQALPPCHLLTILDVQATDEEMILNLHLTMRSTDVPIGLPFNIASYALLLTMIAENHGMVPGQLVIEMVNCHIYADQLELVPTQLEREPLPLPTFKLPKGIDYADPNTLTREKYEEVVEALEGYNHHPFIKYPVAV